ncbi:MAG TPA: hypothetical protein DDY87_06090 [Clostridiales bacterium]|nr:hypothetical protein [Clostridiales bacterium]
MTEQEQQVLYRQIMEGSSQPGWFSTQLKIVYDHLDGRSAEGHIVAEKEHCNPFNIVHGGVYYTLMDQLAGMAAAATGRGGVTLDANVSYLRSARAGETVCCRLEAVHIGKSVAVYDAKCFGENGELQATGTFHLFFLKPVETMTDIME